METVHFDPAYLNYIDTFLVSLTWHSKWRLKGLRSVKYYLFLLRHISLRHISPQFHTHKHTQTTHKHTQQGRGKTYKDYLPESNWHYTLQLHMINSLSELYKMTSGSQQMTALVALELFWSRQWDRGGCFRRGRRLEVNSESNDSDYETNEETATHSPPSKTFT